MDITSALRDMGDVSNSKFEESTKSSPETRGKFDRLLEDDKLDGLSKSDRPQTILSKNEIDSKFSSMFDDGKNSIDSNDLDIKEETGDELSSLDNDTGEEDDNSKVEKTYPCHEEIDGKVYYYDDNGTLYRVDNDLIPNSEYELNGYKYKTDDKGRIISAEGKLHLKNRDGRLNIRDSIDDIGKGDQQEGDVRGHLIGDQFDGTNGLENMIPQDANINGKDFLALEQELAQKVKDGQDVYVSIEPIYDGDSRRPIAIVVTYIIDGEVNVRVFPNGKDE